MDERMTGLEKEKSQVLKRHFLRSQSNKEPAKVKDDKEKRCSTRGMQN
jgi:hypothetical protein